jgi:integrase/recombinase XerD
VPAKKRPKNRRPEQPGLEQTPGGPGRYVTAFVRYLEAECGMSANTLLAYRRDVERYSEWLVANGSPRLADVDLAWMTAYLRHLAERGLAATSIARHLVSIKSYFRYLVLEGVLQDTQVDLLASPKLWQHLPKVLSPTMVDRLLTAPGNDDKFPLRDRAILATLYATGARVSEACGLSLRDVHLDEGFCRVLGKGNKERIVSLNPVARVAIRKYLRLERPEMARSAENPHLFVTRTGGPISRAAVWNLVKKYAARCGCSAEVSPHTLRHSFATHMLAGGAEIRALQEMLGHASVRTTQLYTHVDHGRMKAIHAKHHPRA